MLEEFMVEERLSEGYEIECLGPKLRAMSFFGYLDFWIRVPDLSYDGSLIGIRTVRSGLI
jgi:hypothetical protein